MPYVYRRPYDYAVRVRPPLVAVLTATSASPEQLAATVAETSLVTANVTVGKPLAAVTAETSLVGARLTVGEPVPAAGNRRGRFGFPLLASPFRL